MEEDKRKVNVITLFQKAGLQNHESAVDPEQLTGVVLGLYFSAHWCAQRPIHLRQTVRPDELLEEPSSSLQSIMTAPAGAPHAGSSLLC